MTGKLSNIFPSAYLINLLDDSGMSKEKLAEKPVPYLLPGTQRQIEIGFNTGEGKLCLKYQGIAFGKLPQWQRPDQICRNKIENTQTGALK